MSASAYTNRRRVTTLAKSAKVQYYNHSVSVDNISNGVLPCTPDLTQIIYIPNPPCPCITSIAKTIIDGGSSGDHYPVLDGGYPWSHGRIIDSGII